MRLIDADALNDILEYMINEADIKSWEYIKEPVVAHHYEMLKQQIEEILTGISGLPTIESAQPEIIHCSNCRFFKRNIPCTGGHYNGCEMWLDDGDEIRVMTDDYCSKALPKEGEQDEID